jgi:DNA polymerase V
MTGQNHDIVFTHAIAKPIGNRCTSKVVKLDLSCADVGWIRGQFGVQGVRTVYELQGISCYLLEENPSDKKSIVVSRIFGRPVTSIDELKEAAATYAARAGEKLRQDGLAAEMMTVFVATSRFIKNRYFNVHTTAFLTATSDSSELVTAAVSSIEAMYREGFDYKRTGVLLHNLVGQERIQRTLFDMADREKAGRLMRTIDTINRRGDCSVRWAAEGLSKPWHTQFRRLSGKFTTRWDQLPVVS